MSESAALPRLALLLSRRLATTFLTRTAPFSEQHMRRAPLQIDWYFVQFRDGASARMMGEHSVTHG